MRHISIILLLFLLNTQVKSQEVWNLSKCIDYAIENNIDLNIQRNQVVNQEINLLESKANLLPDLNLGGGVNVHFGRNIDGNTNDITYSQTVSNNFWINSSIDLFQGLLKQNTIKYNKFLLSANKEESEVVKNKLIFDVIKAYYISLYSIGLENVAKNQLNISEVQYRRMQRLVDVGKESPIKVQDLKSQWATDKLHLTKAQNQRNKQILELKQLLRLDAQSDFIIDTSNNIPLNIRELSLVDSIYNNALCFLPEIKQQEYLLDASQKDLSISKGKISPRLYLSAGMGTDYFDGDELAYSSQIKNNQNQQIRLGLHIPVFNGASTYSSIKRKKIAINNRMLEIEKNKERVYSEIQRVLDNVKSAEKEYTSSLELYNFSKLSLQNTSKRLEKGLVGTSDFEIAKQRLASAEAEMIKSKLTYIMYSQILEFYQTGSWNHLNINKK